MVWQIEFVRVLFTDEGTLLSLVDEVVLYFTENVEKLVNNSGEIRYSETISEKVWLLTCKWPDPFAANSNFLGLGYNATLTFQKQS